MRCACHSRPLRGAAHGCLGLRRRCPAELAVARGRTYGVGNLGEYRLFLQSGDSVETERQEAFHAWVVNQLQIVPPRRLQYRKYRDRAHMQRVTGQLTNGWADPPAWTAHSIWTWDAHEAVHVYTAVIGRPSDFFNEGIAVALSVDPSAGRFVSLWNNTPIDDIARSLHRTGTLPAIPTDRRSKTVEVPLFRAARCVSM